MEIVISTIAGLILVPLVDFINSRLSVEQAWLKFLVALLSSLIFGLATVLGSNQLSLESLQNVGELFQNLSVIFIASQSVFNLYWKNSGLRANMFKAKPVEAVNPVQPAPTAV